MRDASGIRCGVLQYHLETLERLGFVESFKAGRFRRYYAVSSADHEANRLHAVTRDERYSKLLQAIDWTPGATNGELRYLFPQVTRQAVGYRLKRLNDLGAVQSREKGRSVGYWLTDAGATVVYPSDFSGIGNGHCEMSVNSEGFSEASYTLMTRFADNGGTALEVPNRRIVGISVD